MTPEQRTAAEAARQPGLIVAGAGSGKTATIAARVGYLVTSGAVQAHEVLGLTFTRKACGELASRLRRQLGELTVVRNGTGGAPAAAEPTVATYHSYAAGLLREHAVRGGAEPDLRLASPAVCWQLAARVVGEYAGPLDAVTQGPEWVIGAVLRIAGELAEHLVTPEQLRAHAAELASWAADSDSAQVRAALKVSTARIQLLPLVEAYTQRKRALGLIDHGDQVALAARLAMSHPVIGQGERARFRAVLLDEYQDTGFAQRVLLRALFGGGHPVTAVGDPCQSIYGWRGASPAGLRAFPSEFPLADGVPAPVHRLSVSFRNPPEVLAAANRLADPLRASGELTPVLSSSREAGAGSLCVAMHPTAAAEAYWLADRLARMLNESSLRPAEVAVLVRRRGQIPLLRAALTARKVPVEVVGLGGLLDVPEVAEVVACMRAIADPVPGPALARLLTGGRWRLGPRDLAALGRRARELSAQANHDQANQDQANQDHADQDQADQDPGLLAATPVDPGMLAEAVDNPGPAAVYSAVGYRRLLDARDTLRRLRAYGGGPITALVDAVVEELGLDVELAASTRDQRGAQADLDAFREVAVEFSAASASLPAFLAYLRAAAREEFGLQPAPVSGLDTVKLLTVHAAKGLEWRVVAVPGLCDGVFPARSRGGVSWLRSAGALPFPLRGDRADLPELSAFDSAGIRAFEQAVGAREALDEGRLAYVAVTRASEHLLCSGYYWGEGSRPLAPSVFLLEIKASGAEVDLWTDPPPPDATNPTAGAASLPWPPPPEGPALAEMRAAAEAVDKARGQPPPVDSPWRAEVDLLLSERLRGQGTQAPVLLSEELTVSTLAALRCDPASLARALRRPMPQPPAPAASTGRAFHRWLEQHFAVARLIEFDELTGSADDEPFEAGLDLGRLQEAFAASEWSRRTPLRVEQAFEMSLAGVLVRGRIDAVFADSDGGYTVIDWKTGPCPAKPDPAATLQLAVYRLAWSRLAGVALRMVRAGLHYVPDQRTVWLAELGDAEALASLITALPVAAAAG